MPNPMVHTDFPSGQLGEYEWVAADRLRATIYREWDENHVNTQSTWYYFRLDGVRGVPLTIEITGLDDVYEGRKGHSLEQNDKPFWSVDNAHWEKLTTTTLDQERSTLIVHLTPPADVVWIAHLEPYTEEHLGRLADDCAGSRWLRMESTGRSVRGRDLPLWTITDPAPTAGGRKVVWLMGRQHAWETHTSWCLDGFSRYLLGSSPQAAELRRRLVVRLLPFMDPDGVARGGSRFNSHGYDLNRHWDTVDPADPAAWEKTPEIAAAKRALREWMGSGQPIHLFLSFHDTEDDKLLLAPALLENPLLGRLLRGMREIRFSGGRANAGAINSSTVETALHKELGIITGLVELGTTDLPTWRRFVTAEDRVRFGADLARVLGRVLA